MQLLIDDEAKTLIYSQMHDEEIIKMINKGDAFALDYLINKYKNLVRSKAKTYFLVGGDREDIIQEGFIGLYKAIKDYDMNKISSFTYFADTCITRQIITAIKTATRQKHIPLNCYLSLNKPVYDKHSERTLMDTLSNLENDNPEYLIIGMEDIEVIEKKLRKILSELEKNVLMSYLDDKTYQEIAIELNIHLKSVDNALQRVKKKLEDLLGGDGILALDKDI